MIHRLHGDDIYFLKMIYNAVLTEYMNTATTYNVPTGGVITKQNGMDKKLLLYFTQQPLLERLRKFLKPISIFNCVTHH